MVFLDEGEAALDQLYRKAATLYALEDGKFSVEVNDEDWGWVEIYPEYEVKAKDLFKIKVKASSYTGV